MGLINGIRSNPNTKYSVGSFFNTLFEQPINTTIELSRFLLNQTGFKFKPESGRVWFENHSHSDFSDEESPARLIDIVEDMFDNTEPASLRLWSLTDHENSLAFDSIADGSYRLDSLGIEHEVSDDKRYMTLVGPRGKSVILFRSIEYKTNKGEIGIHGYNGNLSQQYKSVDEAIKIAHDTGGFVVINHAYFWEGLAYHNAIDEAVNAGVDFIELNGTEIPPQSHSIVKSKQLAKQYNLPLIASGDAHTLEMYNRSGVSFDFEDFNLNGGLVDPVDAIKSLINQGNFENHFNYVTIPQFLNFFTDLKNSGQYQK